MRTYKEAEEEEGVSDRYKKLEKLGEGTYGIVYKAQSRKDGKIVALKCIRLESVDEGVPCTAIREISLLRELEHPCIVGLYEVDHEDNTLTLVFEYVDLDLKHYQDERGGRFPLSLVKNFTYQLLLGVGACHDRKILHRDLKPQNLLINRKTHELKLADFGLARAFGIPVKTFSNEVVTLWYRAPDVLLGSTKYGPPIDVWSIGCIMAEMASGQPLFPGADNRDELVRIFKVLGTPTEKDFPAVSDLPNLAVEFPQYPKESLPRAVRGLDAQGYDLLAQMLRYDPGMRISCLDALKHPFLANCELPPSVVAYLQAHPLSSEKPKTPKKSSFRFG